MGSKRKLQVFVSSTFSDLIEERQAAVAAILKAGHIPAGMELFTAADVSQMKTIERWIDESDVYMLILGGRYGSIEPTSGLSYTELEYDYARTQGKPTFAVVITEDALETKVRLLGSEYMEKSEPKAFDQFRKKVLTNISSFFSDSKDIKLCVYESLSDLAANHNLKGWVSADDVEDTRALHEDIKKLRDENAALNERIRTTAASAEARSRQPGPSFDRDLASVLEAIEVKIPANLGGGAEVTRSRRSILEQRCSDCWSDKRWKRLSSGEILLLQHHSQIAGAWSGRQRKSCRGALSAGFPEQGRTGVACRHGKRIVALEA